ncbi:MAG: ornithine cyclodeaminase family protein [Candidatus Aminicenantes bacterium]|nr:ornithine cyclodeaminase family protein [Candidatus Aminicenantes bacterium]
MEQKILYLSRADVEAVAVPMDRTIAAVEAMFKEKGEGRVEMPPKPGIHPRPDSFIHAMPAYIPALHSAGMKWVSGFPENIKKGLPYISGLIVLNDPETGIPLTIMDCTWITAMRTGAATAVAAKFLARADSRVAGILGCGVQGRSNLEALKVLFPLQRVLAYDTDRKARERYTEEMSRKFDLDCVPVATPEQAVVGADIVITAGPLLKIPHATIPPGWLGEGAFASLVDYDSYWHRDALKETDKFCTDDIPQLEYYKTFGYFRDIPAVYAELGELVTGRRPGRENPEERTMTCNLGLALDDMATAPLVFKLAVEKGLGTRLPL